MTCRWLWHTQWLWQTRKGLWQTQNDCGKLKRLRRTQVLQSLINLYLLEKYKWKWNVLTCIFFRQPFRELYIVASQRSGVSSEKHLVQHGQPQSETSGTKYNDLCYRLKAFKTTYRPSWSWHAQSPHTRSWHTRSPHTKTYWKVRHNIFVLFFFCFLLGWFISQTSAEMAAVFPSRQNTCSRWGTICY